MAEKKIIESYVEGDLQWDLDGQGLDEALQESRERATYEALKAKFESKPQSTPFPAE